jgi:hypothetical protein
MNLPVCSHKDAGLGHLTTDNLGVVPAAHLDAGQTGANVAAGSALAQAGEVVDTVRGIAALITDRTVSIRRNPFVESGGRTLARFQPAMSQTALLRRPAAPTTSACSAAARASSTERAVSGLAMMSSTQASKEKVLAEVVAGAGAAATEAAVARAARGRANLTILDGGSWGLKLSLTCGLGNKS